MKKLLNILILLVWVFTCNCGSGMIGLFPDKHGRIVMDYVDVIDQGGTTYTIEAIGYYEENIDCNAPILPIVIPPDWEELNVWRTVRPWGDTESESILMENGYIGPVQKSLHEEYYNRICGE